VTTAYCITSVGSAEYRTSQKRLAAGRGMYSNRFWFAFSDNQNITAGRTRPCSHSLCAWLWVRSASRPST
jgi:hypothetical protein